MSLPDLKTTLTLDDGPFNGAVTRAGVVLGNLAAKFDGTADASRRAESALHRAGSRFRNTIVTMGAVKFLLMDLDSFFLAFPKSVAKVGGEFQKLQVQMEGLSKAATSTMRRMEGIASMNFVVGLSQNSPFEVKALADAFVKLKSGGIDPASGSMQALVDGVAKFGGSSETLKRASVAIQQMGGKGVISMEELRQQLGEAIPNAMQLMAQGMGLSVAELTNKVSKGVVTSRTALARMFTQMKLDASGAAEAMMKTLPGAIAQMNTEWQLFQKTVANQGFLGTLAVSVKELTEAMQGEKGQEFAKIVGNALRELTEFAAMSARWLVENIDLVKKLGAVLLALWGGGKLARLFDSIKSKFVEREEAAKRASAASRDEFGNIIKAQTAQEKALARIEAMREVALKRAETRIARQSQLAQDSIAREEASVKKLEQRRTDLIDQADAKAESRQQKAVNRELAQAEAAKRKLASLTDRLDVVKKGVKDNDDGRIQKFEAQKAQTLDRLNTKASASVDQLSALESRRDKLLAAQKIDTQTKLAGLVERRGNAEAAIGRQMVTAQERVLGLEEKRRSIMERANANALQSIQSQSNTRTRQLAEVQAQLDAIKSTNLTQVQKDERIGSLRAEETLKRVAYDREIQHLGAVRTRRLELEAIHEREQKLPSGPIRGPGGQFVAPDSEAGAAVISKRNAERQTTIDRLHAQETALAATARALGEERTEAQKAADALARHKNVSEQDVAALQSRADALQKQITSQKELTDRIKASGLSVAEFTKKVQQQLAGVDGQITGQKALIASHEDARRALGAEFDAKSKAITQTTTAIAAIDREIAAKQGLIQKNLADIESVRQSAAAKSQMSAATASNIAALEREIQTQQGAINAHQAQATALRNSTAEHDSHRAAIGRKITAIDAEIQASQKAKSASEAHLQTLRAQVPANDEVVRGLEKQKQALQGTIKGMNDAGNATNGFANAMKTAGGAIVGFGRSLVASAGFAIAFALVIEGVMWAFDKLTKKTRDAEAAQQALNRARLGMPAEGDVEKIQGNINRGNAERANVLQEAGRFNNLLAAEVKRSAQLQALLVNPNTSAGQRPGIQQMLSKSKEEVARLQGRVSELNASIKSIDTNIASNAADQNYAKQTLQEYDDGQVIAKSLAQISKNYESRLKQRDEQRKFNALNVEINKLEREGKTTEAATLRLKLKAVGEEYEKGQLSTFNRSASEVVSSLPAINAPGPGASADVLEKFKRDTATRAKLLESIQEKRASIIQGTASAVDTNFFGGGKDKTVKDTWLDNFIESQREKSVDLMEVSREVSDKLIDAATIRKYAEDKIDAMVSRKDGGVDPKKDAGKISTAKDALFRNIMAKEMNEASALFQKSIVNMEADKERVEEAFQAGGQTLDRKNPMLVAVEKEILALAPKRALLKKELDALGLTWDEYVAKRRGGAIDAGAAATLTDLINQTKSLQEANETDDEARQRRITANHIEEQTKRVSAHIESYQIMGTWDEAQVEKVRTIYAQLEAFIKARTEALARALEGPIAKMARDWSDGMKNMKTAAAGWANSFVDQLVEGKLKFGEFVQSVLKDIAKIKIKEALSDSIGVLLDSAVAAIGGAIGLKGAGAGKQSPTFDATGAQRVFVTNGPESVVASVLGDNAPAGTAEKGLWERMTKGMSDLWAKLQTMFSDVGRYIGDIFRNIDFGGMAKSAGGFIEGIIPAITSFFGFANGGIMTSMGAAPLRKYAMGGIAKSPQLAMFGEGSQPEAFVPLPDGRSIPVSLSGAQPAAAPEGMPVTINLINQTGQPAQAHQAGQRFDGRQMILDVVLSGMAQPGGFRDNMKSMAGK